MEPLSPNDPLWKLLGQAGPVKARPNFTQNVLRAARQTPQERGWLAGMRAWFAAPSITPMGSALASGVFAALAIAFVVAQMWPHAAGPKTFAQGAVKTKAVSAGTAGAANETEFPAVAEVATEWETMEKFDALLAVEDTAELTDREIHLLLY